MIGRQALEHFKEHVLRRYPEEACGFLINDSYAACPNVHPTPRSNFRISLEDRVLLANSMPIQAVLHSHPYCLNSSSIYVQEQYKPEWPSVADQAAYLADDIPWGIVATDGQGISAVNWLDDSSTPILERREFNWFTADCYALVRDWHRLHTKIVMPNFVRKWEFWKDGLNSIEENALMIEGITKHPTSKARIGDIAVFALNGSTVVNHMGIISGNNEFFHQFAHQYAHITRWDTWKHWCRYVFRLENIKND